MSARSRLHDPLAETPFWRTRSFVLGAVTAGLLLAAGMTVFLIRENRRQQMQWRLDDDPQLSALKASLTEQIQAAKSTQPRAPVALWLGRVREFTVSQQTSGTAPPVSILKLEEANLLAGERARNDTSAVTISGKQYIFGGPQPRPGESWLVSVWRDADGNSVIHSATRADRRLP
jgi:hypothetical protein